MPDEERQLKKRFEELAARAAARGCWTYSEFLTMAEQETLCTLRLEVPYVLEGGYPAAERRLAVFGAEEDLGYPPAPPLCCLSVVPVSQKFADALSHRDFLGSLMGLGIRREVLGDIILHENCGYVFCLDSIADYIAEQFKQVKRTTVRAARTDAHPGSVAAPPEISQIVVASERLDAVVAAVYKLSRAESQELFGQKKVFVNSRLVENPSGTLKPGAMVSVRGLGRFLYEGIETETRKSRLRVNVRVY